MERAVSIITEQKQMTIKISDKEQLKKISAYIADYIIKKYQSEIIEQFFCNNFGYISCPEQTFVREWIKRDLSETSIQKELLSALKNEVYLYLAENTYINIKGFTLFRMKEYMKLLHTKINDTVEAYLAEKEYSTLIEYLTLYVNLQEAVINRINITVDADGKYIITDSHMREIFTLINYDDTLLDVIITLAPKKIKIYSINNFTNKELLKTILSIFKERVELYYEALPI